MIGRTEECAALREVLAAARSGSSATLVLRGEAGIGKTSLLEYVTSQAEGFRVLRVTGVESEMEFGFAGIYHLVQPLLSGISRLPGPQRAALESAFGIVAGPQPDRFLVALATLTLLSDASGQDSKDRGLFIAVDDAQWLDQASCAVLAFVARRLDADRIALVFAVRDAAGNHAYFEKLSSIRVRELSVAAARELIGRLAAGPVAPGVADQIAARVRGNPLALTETIRELTRAQLSGSALLPDPLPLGVDAQALYWRKVAALPPDHREFLLLAAAEPSGEPELLGRAAGLLGLDPSLARGGQISELIMIADRASFRHPLIRSAVYAGSSEGARRQAHAAIAEAITAGEDPDQERIAWHRAAAAVEPDEEIAVLLEDAAARVRRRGGLAAAATFLRRAAELSAGPGRRSARLLAAAGAEYGAGRMDEATALLDQVEPGLSAPGERAEALKLRGEIQSVLGDGHHAPATLLHAAQALAPLDPRESRDVLLDAMMAGFYADDQAWIDALGAIRGQCPDDGTARASVPDLMLDGYAALLTAGPGKGSPVLRQALSALIAADVPDDQRARWYWSGIWCAVELLDFDAWRLLTERWAALFRDQGALAMLPLALDYLGTWRTYAGHLNAAEEANVEGREILAATGTPDRMGIRGVELLVPAWRGDDSALRAAAAGMTRDCVAHGQRRAVLYPHLGFAILGTGTRDYASALMHARVLLDDNGPYFGVVSLPYAVEAAVHCGDWETAELALSRLIARAEAGSTEWGLGLSAQCRAIAVRAAGPDGDAEREALFTEAIGHLERSAAIADLARTRLLYGEWLRRQLRRGPAQKQLLDAWRTFDALGAASFAERARLELVSTGVKGVPVSASANRAQAGLARLTERESQVARLVATGATNAEVATQLFITASTVDHHMRSIFRKLGISSRTMLAARFQDRF